MNAHALNFQASTGTLWIGLENGTIKVINNTGPENTHDFLFGNMVTQLTFNHAYDLLAVGFRSGTILLIDPNAYEVLETLPGHTAQVNDIKFSQNDRFLISGGYDRRNLLWNLEAIKEPPIVWNDHQSFVWAIGFAENENEIISGELFGTIKKYHLHMAGYADEMCNQVTRNLTTKEWETFVGNEIPQEKTCESTN